MGDGTGGAKEKEVDKKYWAGLKGC